MSGGSRKLHTKTRRGCAQCKKRRVRCNLRPPACSNCVRRGEQCEYQVLQIDFTPQILDTVFSNNPITGASQEHVQRQPSNDPLDNELEAHFIAFTSQTLGIIPMSPDRDPWRREVPMQMHKGSFLRYGMLSIAALHLSHLRPELWEVYYQRACQHHDQALPLFRAEVNNIGKENVLDVIAFCIIVSTFNLYNAKEGIRVGLAGEGAVAVFEPFLVMRSGALLVHECLPAISDHGGNLKQSVGHLWSQPPPPFDDEVRQAVDGLDEISAVFQAAGIFASPCHQALALLKQSFFRFSVRPQGWLHIIFWPSSVSQEYVDMLTGGDQGAMTIFLYWCAYMSNAPKRWWLEGWAVAAGNVYLQRIDPLWHSLLAWPRSQLQVEVPSPPNFATSPSPPHHHHHQDASPPSSAVFSSSSSSTADAAAAAAAAAALPISMVDAPPVLYSNAGISAVQEARPHVLYSNVGVTASEGIQHPVLYSDIDANDVYSPIADPATPGTWAATALFPPFTNA